MRLWLVPLTLLALQPSSDACDLETRLELSFWSASLNEADEHRVIEGLRSARSNVRLLAIANALAHRVEAALPLFRERADGARGRFMAALAKGFGPPEFVPGRLAARLHEFPSMSHEAPNFHDKLLDLIVMLIARRQRLGAHAPWIGRLPLTEYHAELLEFSKMPNEKAIRTLIDRTSRYKGYCSDDHLILGTYGMPAVEAIIDHLEDPKKRRRTTSYGIIALLCSPRKHYRTLPSGARARLLVVLDQLASRPNSNRVAQRARSYAILFRVLSPKSRDIEAGLDRIAQLTDREEAMGYRGSVLALLDHASWRVRAKATYALLRMERAQR
jgi:hypothetical protein